VPGVGKASLRILMSSGASIDEESQPLSASLPSVATAARNATEKQSLAAAPRCGPPLYGRYMAGLVASRANPVIAAHYQKLRAVGKAAKQALTCIRELLLILNAILGDRKP
jgi:transposase